MDPRFTDVFGALTGIDLDKMSENRANHEKNQEEVNKREAEARAKREAEAEARRKAEEEAALPSEEK